MTGSPPPEPSDKAAQNVPTCFRHPERETYVRCTRCDKSICPDCMRAASVGFHCVDCVAEGSRSVRPTRTTFGGRAAAAPYATWILLGAIALCFLAQQLDSQLTYQFGMLGANVLPSGAVGGVAVGEWYRLLTSAFLHAGWMHLLFNGLALYIVGPQLERLLGHSRYLALWVLSALGGSVLSYLVVPDQLSVGASGAIFGLFGATFVIGRRLGVDTRFIVGLIGINLLITFIVPNISWTAHIGGLVSGTLLALVYAYLPRGSARGRRRDRARTIMHSVLTGGYAVLLLGLVVGQTMSLLS